MLEIFILTILFQITFTYQKTPLDEYINNEFDIKHVNFKTVSMQLRGNVREYRLNITTLKWLADPISSQNVWQHDFYVYAPINRQIKRTALLYIGSGYNDNRTDNDANIRDNLLKISNLCDCLVGLLKQIPNQPISFRSDSLRRMRVEDDIVSYTWKLYFEEKLKYKNLYKETEYIPLLAPMTKAIVRTMDIFEIFAINALRIPVQKFVLAGESKRGWATWLAGALDDRDRVAAIVPIVFNGLNMHANLHHHFRSLQGAYSFALKDFYDAGFIRSFDTPETQQFIKLIDPYYYLERLENIKIFSILATNDEYFLPDSTKFYWNKLLAYTNDNSYLRWLPNVGHNIASQRDKIFESIEQIINHIEEPNFHVLPKLRWNFSQNFTHVSIKAILKDTMCPMLPLVTLYSTRTLNNQRRDFRSNILKDQNVVNQNIQWNAVNSRNMNIVNLNSFDYIITFEIDNREISNQFWQAFYIQFGIQLRNEGCIQNKLFYITTEIFVIPDIYTYQDCFREECHTYLV